MKFRGYLALLVTVGLVTTTVIAAEAEKKATKETEEKVKLTCPISGKEINKEAFVAYKEAKVFFCCERCPGAFEKDTAKFSAKANHQLIATKQFEQVKCPLSGGKINKEATAKVAHVKVAFCCENCQKKVNDASDADKIKLVFNDKSFEKGFKIKKEKEKKAKEAA